MQVVWRDATHADLPRILELWAEQQERFAGTGVKVDQPVLFYPEGDTEHAFYPYRPPIARVRVAENDGVITGFKTIECVCEVSVVTGDKEVMESLPIELTEDARWAKAKGFRSGWGLAPARFAKALARFLRKYPYIRPWPSLTPVGIDLSELGD